MAAERQGDPMAAKRPRPPGGYRQQLRWAAALDAPSQPAHSALAQFLLEKWCWGEFSAPVVQQCAAAAVADGAKGPELLMLSKLGTKGLYQQNCHAELLRKVKPSRLDTSMAFIHTWVRRGAQSITRVSHPILLPHIVFSLLYSDYKEGFELRMLGGARGNVRKFWESMTNHPSYQDHPAKLRPDHVDMCVPLAIHADGTPVIGAGRAWAKSLDIYSWGSVLCKSSTKEMHMLMYMFFPQMQVNVGGKEAAGELAKMLRWSLYWLFIGCWPKRDPDGNAYADGTPEARQAGQPLAGGWYATLWIIRGDLDEMAKSFKLRHPSSRQPCSVCKADTGAIPWTDGNPITARWIPTTWRPQEWLDAHPDRHALFTLPGVSITTYVPDMMHCFHLGAYQYAFGSILKFLTHEVLAGRKEDNLQQVWECISTYYRANQVQSKFNTLKLTMFAPEEKGFPYLKGKAGELRHFAPALLCACERFLRPQDATHKKILLMLRLVVDIESLMDDHADEYVFPEDAAKRFEKSVFAFAQLNTDLANHFHPRGVHLFNHTIKFHYLLHIARAAHYMNPRLSWCYSGEDYMKRIKTLVQGSCRGTAAHIVVTKAVHKYVRGLGLALHADMWQR